MVAQGMAAAYGGSGGDPEIIRAHLRTMVEPGLVERHISDAGEEFSMTPKGWALSASDRGSDRGDYAPAERTRVRAEMNRSGVS